MKLAIIKEIFELHLNIPEQGYNMILKANIDCIVMRGKSNFQILI